MLRVVVPSLAIALLGGCADTTETFALLATPRAKVKLKKAQAELTHTSNTQWTLDKVGSLGAQTVTWQATATQGGTTDGLLIFNGIFTVENKGNAGATIGNIVVNLQTYDPATDEWTTQASNVADATSDDAATTANVAKKGTHEKVDSFTESAASGSLLFTDASTNSTFALVPQVTFVPDEVKKLLFSATFDNNVLDIPVGTEVRAEIVVSFGNAKDNGNGAANVDINGNGIIDGDEAAVQSVNATINAVVPAGTPSNLDVVLTDTIDDVTTTGTVTFSNFQITFTGPYSALVTVNYDAGTEGGTITNCAHLTATGQTAIVGDEQDQFPNVIGVDLTACDTQVIGPHGCTPGAPGCGWDDGDMVSYSQADWGDDPVTDPAAALLVSEFGVVYPFSFIEVGISGAGGFSIIFTSAAAILNYQPATGAPDRLNADLVDPASTSSGVFGGYVLALQLDVDFSDAGVLGGSSGLRFGDLRLCNLTATPLLDGTTIREFLAIANQALGGGTAPYTIDELAALTNQISGAFTDGAPTLFAQQNIVSGPSCN